MDKDKIVLFLGLDGKGLIDKIFINIAKIGYLVFRLTRIIFPQIKFIDLGKFLLKDSIAKIRGTYFFCRSISEDLSIIIGIWEKDVISMFNPQAEDVVIDVGAHIGLYTFLASDRIGKKGVVISLEPHPDNFRLLKKNIRLNKKTNVMPLQYVVWSENKVLKLYESVSIGAHHSVFGARKGVSESYILVNTITIDSLMEKLKKRKVDWIKIDVEGSELEVIRGAKKTLLKHNIKIIVECISKKSYLKTKDFLEKLGYSMKRTPLKFYYFAYKDSPHP